LGYAITKNINTSANNLKKGIILFVGFQGHGKTTSVNKLAYRLMKQNFTVAVATLDTIRPAAMEQLKENADRFQIPFLTPNNSEDPLLMAKEILNYKNSYDYVLVDTAGVNSLEETNLKKINSIIKILHPSEILLIVNSMWGHSMFKMLENIKETIPVTGSIMTNIDGDKKGGGFISFYYIMKVPILFISNGEKINNLEKFNPKSITNILLGEIDFEGLEGLIKDNIPKSMEELFLTKIMNGVFTFNELILFTTQTTNIGLGRIANSLGMNNISMDPQVAKENIKIMTSVVQSMTKKERNNQVHLSDSRLKRISGGCGHKLSVVQQIVQSYEQTRKQIFMMTDLLKKGGDPAQIINLLKNMPR